MLSVAVSLVGGLLFGYLFLDTGVKDTLDLILMSALDVMIFIAGIEIGSNRGILKRICNLHSALLALAIPLAVAFFLIPLLVRVHKFLALAPSGAATMDSGLPVVIKYTNLHVGMYSFINGLVLTLIVPVLISWLLSLR